MVDLNVLEEGVLFPVFEDRSGETGGVFLQKKEREGGGARELHVSVRSFILSRRAVRPEIGGDRRTSDSLVFKTATKLTLPLQSSVV